MALGLSTQKTADDNEPFDRDAAAPGSLWDPESGRVEGGRSHPLEMGQTMEREDDGSFHP